MELTIGAVILLVGILIGRFLPGWGRPRRSTLEEVKPLCGCGHASSFHEERGRCHALVEVARWDQGKWAGIESVPCSCQKYAGPEPLPAFYAPELTE
ncbi:hypothetical protein ACWDWO_24860 [Actinopolymorpha singaporensis]|uniref:Uncharacterized protein n=1 Tax=Actinopolymorpha singaporensis TaxID=117157 RepID=A0A1H1MS20_9ACTN|nr:hypothetical protein SAMN04489717_0925 [Actinopolymorpha singaporensis]